MRPESEAFFKKWMDTAPPGSRAEFDREFVRALQAERGHAVSVAIRDERENIAAFVEREVKHYLPARSESGVNRGGRMLAQMIRSRGDTLEPEKPKAEERPNGVRVVLYSDPDAADHSTEVRPTVGYNAALIFPGFCVLVTHEGVALVLPSNYRKTIAEMPPGKDRLASLFDGPRSMDAKPTPAEEATLDRVVAASLEVWPKADVP